MIVITEYIAPPVGTDAYDWAAFIEGQEDWLIGRGPTEKDALVDLCEKLAADLGARSEND